MLLVTDTNIWIDLENGNLLEPIFGLPYQFIMTDFAANEISSNLWASLAHMGVKKYGLSSEQITDIDVLSKMHPSVSSTDLSSLVLARDLPAGLLSGDKPLRKLAKAHAIEVHGVLWVLDGLVDHQIISPSQACLGLQWILAENARLPEVECHQRLRKWRSVP